MTQILNWNITRKEADLIRQIQKRALKLADAQRVDVDAMTLFMDIQACHANGCPLELAELAAAPDFDFVHDVFGIRRHINRETGQLEDCFLPRYAKKA